MAKKAATKKQKEKDSTPEGLVKAKEAAEMIGIQPSTFRHHVRKRGIEPAETLVFGNYRIPLYRIEDIEKMRSEIRPYGKPGPGRPRKEDPDHPRIRRTVKN